MASCGKKYVKVVIGLRVHVRAIVLSAMFAAIIFVAIQLFWIPYGFGVIHFGDSLIFVAATLLPFPFGLFVAAIGPGLFNLVNIVIWLPFTVVIKPLMALCFTSKGDTILGPVRNRVAPFIAAGINTALYFGANMFLFDGWAAGVAALPGLIIQGAGSIVFFFVIGLALDRLGVKRMLFR